MGTDSYDVAAVVSNRVKTAMSGIEQSAKSCGGKEVGNEVIACNLANAVRITAEEAQQYRNDWLAAMNDNNALKFAIEFYKANSTVHDSVIRTVKKEHPGNPYL